MDVVFKDGRFAAVVEKRMWGNMVRHALDLSEKASGEDIQQRGFAWDSKTGIRSRKAVRMERARTTGAIPAH